MIDCCQAYVTVDHWSWDICVGRKEAEGGEEI